MNRQSGPANEKRAARSEIKLSRGFLRASEVPGGFPVASELGCGLLVASGLTVVFWVLPLLCAVVL
jgi:hypothetical protein